MALTFLNLCNSLLSKFNEEKLTSGDFSNSYGFQDTVKEAINYVILDLNQFSYYWPFNYQEGTITTVVDQQTYPAESSAKLTDWNTFYLVKDEAKNVAGSYLPVLMYDQWNQYQREHDLDNDSTQRIPQRVFWLPDNSIGISPIPDDVYTIKYGYFQFETELTNHDDTTRIPEHFKNVIIDGATWYIYMFQEDAQKAQIQWEAYSNKRNNMREILLNKSDMVVYAGIPSQRRFDW